jgi:predicted CXXCH cytochrome family protein
VLCLFLLVSCKEKALPPAPAAAPARPAELAKSLPPPVLEAPEALDGAAKACASCHAAQFQSWSGSQHAHALRRATTEKDQAAFAPEQILEHQSFTSRMHFDKGILRLDTRHRDGRSWSSEGKLVIGVAPLVQFLAPYPGGRLQAVGMALDTGRREWFDVFEGQDRQPEEWGHWLNRGMCANSQCLECHTTGFVKGYDGDKDCFDTRAAELGISCARCHSGLEAHLKNPAEKPLSMKGDFARSTQTCASCHSRREVFDGDPRPGQDFFDAHRPVLADAPGVYHVDGQILDEDFEYGSFLMSRMHHAGVQCLHCHDPHSGKTRLPIKDNSLCLQCHGQSPQMGAQPIDPLSHSGHAAGSEGNLCVNCHMPETKYMVRDPRRDHGFTCPDPQMSKDLGVPNACNRCHSDKSVDWALAEVKKRPGFESPKRRHDRQRAAAVAAGRDYHPQMVPGLLEALKNEKIPAWRAALLSLLSPAAATEAVQVEMREALGHPHPLVRSAGIRGLVAAPGGRALIRPLLKDPVKMVRIDAAWALLPELAADSPERQEIETQLLWVRDQPPGALRQGEYLRSQGKLGEAELWMKRAASWDNSAGGFETLAHFYHALGRPGDSAAAFREAIKREDGNAALHYSLALLLNESGDRKGALASFLESAKRDPDNARLLYNLGLLQLQMGLRDEAVGHLRRSLQLHDSPDTRQALEMALGPGSR